MIASDQRASGHYLADWLKRDMSQLNIIATYNLVFNASLLVDEGLGYALTLDKLINTEGSKLCFRPFSPKLEFYPYIVWKKYQVFSKAAKIFVEHLKGLIAAEERESV